MVALYYPIIVIPAVFFSVRPVLRILLHERVRQHQCHHCFHHGDSAGQHARVVPALATEFNLKGTAEGSPLEG